MRTVAWAEPASVVTRLANGYTTQVSANAKHDKPLRGLDTVVIGLRISQRLNVDALSLLDLVGSSVTDEDGLTTPLDDDLEQGESVRKPRRVLKTRLETYVLALRDSSEVDLDLGHGQHIGGSRHVDEEICCSRSH